ncbi:hypothetical protein SDC9_191552 [bioreactor metagenome]|uniref:Uncharacterized protein n=1 Tax=bioreactor metagenome TaxID=1076179 RepID=A0A645HY71_9ZZZZ
MWGELRTAWPRLFRPWLAAVLLAAAGIALLADAAMPVLRMRSAGASARKRTAIREAAAWIREHYAGPAAGPCGYQPLYYHAGRRPWVMAPGLEQIGYLAGGGDLQFPDPEFVAGRICPDYLVTPDEPAWNALAAKEFTPVCRSMSYVIWAPKTGETR